MTYVQWGLCILFVLLVIVFVLLRSHRTLWVSLIGAALFLWSWPPSTALLAYTLEHRYPVTRFPQSDAGAFVVLSASISPPNDSQPEVLPSYGTFLRCEHAAWLYRNWKAMPVVVSGGSGPSKIVMADVMRDVLRRAGVPDAMIWTERRSKSTYDNALFTAELLRAKQIRRIVLVTEAHHMLRSDLCFRKQGIEVVPSACNYRYILFSGQWQDFFPSSKMITSNEDTLHEWMGLVWYRVSGKV
jgi:uncharacterized SAM-binding protein YcdF (DUF218 family)